MKNNYSDDFRYHFFSERLVERDREVFASIKGELQRQENEIELIASENIVSRAVLDAQGSVLTNKYAEGYPGRRYYGGCDQVDIAENIAIERAKKLFNCSFANVQPHSGAQANGAVLLALLSPGDTIVGMSLNSGGHLTHGAAPALSGKWFNAVHYEVDRETGVIDYEQVEKIVVEARPKLLIAGGSSYARELDFVKFRAIADKVGAFLMVDMAHFSGLVAAGLYLSPLPHAHVVTTTTHKTLRGPRGGMILSNDPDLGKRINAAVFPGLQGGPLMHVIAAKAVAFGEALQPAFKDYAKKVKANAIVLADILMQNGYDVVSNGTDTHLILIDLRKQGVTGKATGESLGRGGITCNKNSIPYDPQPPVLTSGIRLGTPAATTRGFGPEEFKQVGDMIVQILDGLCKNKDDNTAAESAVRSQVHALCDKFPLYKSELGY